MRSKSEVIKELKNYNKWRRGEEGIDQPNPRETGIIIDLAVRYLEEKVLSEMYYRA